MASAIQRFKYVFGVFDGLTSSAATWVGVIVDTKGKGVEVVVAGSEAM